MPRTEIDGVTTLWDDAPGPFSAALVFGAGVRHETFHTVGVAHLVEHLAMCGLPKTTLDHNAFVDLDATVFHASGDVEDVVAFVAHVCSALRHPPLAELERERRVVQLEQSSACHPAMGWALATRFGLRGPGLSYSEGAGIDHVDDAAVVEFIKLRYVRENAVLVFSGPPPAGLTVDLPSGTVPTAVPPTRLEFPLPGLVHGEVPHPSLSLVLPSGVGAGMLAYVLRDRLEDEARHRRGIAYHVGLEIEQLDADHIIACLHADPSEEDADDMVRLMWSSLSDLARVPPAEQELNHQRTLRAAAVEDDRSYFEWLQAQAIRHVYSLPVQTRDEDRELFASVTPDDVRRLAEDAIGTALVAVTDPPQSPIDGLPDVGEQLYATPDELRRRNPGWMVGRRRRRRRLAEYAAARDGQRPNGQHVHPPPQGSHGALRPRRRLPGRPLV